MPTPKQLANLKPRQPQRGVVKNTRISARVTEQDKARFMAALDTAGYTVAQLIEAIADGKIEISPKKP